MARPTRRQLLAQDARRTVGFMSWVFTDAKRIGVEVPENVHACLFVWQAWTVLLEQQAEEES